MYVQSGLLPSQENRKLNSFKWKLLSKVCKQGSVKITGTIRKPRNNKDTKQL